MAADRGPQGAQGGVSESLPEGSPDWAPTAGQVTAIVEATTYPDGTEDPASGREPGASTPSTDPPEVGRRRFFRLLASDALNTAVAVVGAAGALQRSSSQAAQNLLGMSDAGTVASAPDVPSVQSASAAHPPLVGFRSPFRWEGDRLVLIDQRRLPDELVEVECRSGVDVARAIREMIIRGAPAIGQAAAYGLALTAQGARSSTPYHRLASIRGTANALTNARPTAANARWAMDRMLARFQAVGQLSEDGETIAEALVDEAEAIAFEATAAHTRMAAFGLDVLPEPANGVRVLTHCNTGALACGQVGTALGVIEAAKAAGRPITVYVDETRPYLQGTRLTAWELAQADITHWVIADAAAGWMIARGDVDVVLVGADRIAANGDTANKIGTYPLAVVAARHDVPFIVCGPTSSVDLSIPSGSAIEIEERSSLEILMIQGRRIAPRLTMARNPAFDVTPAELITAIVTDEGVLRAPYGPALAAAIEAAAVRRNGSAGADGGPAPIGSSGARGASE